MATRKRAGSKRGASAEPERSQIAQVAQNLPEVPEVSEVLPSKLPEQAQFPLLVTLSLLASYGLYTVTSPFTSGDLSTVSAHRDKSYEVLFFLIWRALELGVGWYNEFDSKLHRIDSLQSSY